MESKTTPSLAEIISNNYSGDAEGYEAISLKEKEVILTKIDTPSPTTAIVTPTEDDPNKKLTKEEAQELRQ